MINELKLLQFFVRLYPNIKGKGVLAEWATSFFLRKKRPERIISKINNNLKMSLSPYQFIDRYLLFSPDYYDKFEMDFLENNLSQGDVFIDIGANIGIYSLKCSNLVGEKGKIYAIEAVPSTFNILINNIKLNSLTNIIPINIGLSDKTEKLNLFINEKNIGGNTFLESGVTNSGIMLECKTLTSVLADYNVTQINIMKIDIEGYEYKVMKHFFENSHPKLYPKYIITEFHNKSKYSEEGNTIDLLKDNNYKVLWNKSFNYILEHKDNPMNL